MSTTNPIINDWFLSAILKDGTVGESLQEVEKELRNKQSFVGALRHRIGETAPSKVDAISELAARITTLENTLKFRLSILNPMRKGAWFRSSVSTSAGPFGVHLLEEPVFATFDERSVDRVKQGLIKCWKARNLVDYPLRATEPCLWKVLLSLNFELYAAGDLGSWPRLDKLPEELPPEFESRSLRAFLMNVKAEYVTAVQRLDECYEMLLKASHRLWLAMASSTGNEATQEDDLYDGHRSAEKLRQEFRSRRSSATLKRSLGKSTQDIEALSFMGFDDFPELEVLRQRYHSLAMEMHPDRAGGSESRFKLLAKSYRHLTRQLTR